MKRITVVAALFINESGEILLGRRPSGRIQPCSWECPGGKVEEGEDVYTALKREIDEELGIEIKVGKLVSAASFTWEERYHVLLFRCHILNGTPQAIHHDVLGWFDVSYARTQLALMPSQFVWYPDIADEVLNYLLGVDNDPPE